MAFPFLNHARGPALSLLMVEALASCIFLPFLFGLFKERYEQEFYTNTSRDCIPEVHGALSPVKRREKRKGGDMEECRVPADGSERIKV